MSDKEMYGWERCSHEGIGQPGCSTCDPNTDRVIARAFFVRCLPIPMILHCPACGERHIDKGEFATKPHNTHACQHCGVPWTMTPKEFPTVGVQFLPGYKDEER